MHCIGSTGMHCYSSQCNDLVLGGVLLAGATLNLQYSREAVSECKARAWLVVVPGQKYSRSLRWSHETVGLQGT